MLENSINHDITIDELGTPINQLKRGKAVSANLTENEFDATTICHLLRECLKIGAYPWNTSLVTPFHKNEAFKTQIITGQLQLLV